MPCRPVLTGESRVVERFGLLDLRAQAEVLSALRPDTPTLVALADETDARSAQTPIAIGASDRSALRARPKAARTDRDSAWLMAVA
jgi:hypothetical protein